jgi:hypothetical protein
MTTDKKAQSNRRNAQHSTGPKTEAGKEACAGNAITHGLSAKKYLLRGEDPAELTAIYDALCVTYEPKDAVMRDLVMKMAMCYFRANRAFIAEAEHSPLADMLLGDHDARIKNLATYQAGIRKDLQVYERILAEYKKAWDARRKVEEKDKAEADRKKMPASPLSPESRPETGESDETDEPEPTPPKPKGPSTKKKKPVNSDTRDRVAPPVSTPTAAAAATANGSRNPVDPPAATGGSPGETYSTKTSSVAASPRPTSAAGANPKSKPMPASSSEAPITPPALPSGAGGSARPAAATSSVTAPPATSSATREAPIVKAMPASGREASISPPAVPSGSRSETVSTVTAPLLSPPPATASPEQNPKTNPISTAGCSGADHTANAGKIATPPLEASRPPATATAGPMKETRTTVPIAKAPGAAAVRMPEAATVSMSAAPAPPSPPVFTPDQMRKPPQTNFDINNWGNPAPRSVIRR